MKLILVFGFLLSKVVIAAPYKCDFYINKELEKRNIGSLKKLKNEFTAKDLLDKNSKDYAANGYDTLFAYPEGSDPFADDGYKETPLARQLVIAPINLKTSSFSQIRIFIKKIKGKEVVAGYAVVGDKQNPLEENRVILQDTATCKVRLAHNYYKKNSINKMGVSRGWIKVNQPICEKIKNNLPKLTLAVANGDSITLRNFIPEPAVTEDDKIGFDDALRLCEFVVPDIKSKLNLPKSSAVPAPQ